MTHKLLNRSGGIFYPLALLWLVYIAELSNKPNKIFYPLTLLWLTLFRIPNRLDRIFYLLTLLQLLHVHLALDYMVNIYIDCIPLRSWWEFDLYISLFDLQGGCCNVDWSAQSRWSLVSRVGLGKAVPHWCPPSFPIAPLLTF